jgi:hypothetical protein
VDAGESAATLRTISGGWRRPLPRTPPGVVLNKRNLGYRGASLWHAIGSLYEASGAGDAGRLPDVAKCNQSLRASEERNFSINKGGVEMSAKLALPITAVFSTVRYRGERMRDRFSQSGVDLY